MKNKVGHLRFARNSIRHECCPKRRKVKNLHRLTAATPMKPLSKQELEKIMQQGQNQFDGMNFPFIRGKLTCHEISSTKAHKLVNLSGGNKQDEKVLQSLGFELCITNEPPPPHWVYYLMNNAACTRLKNRLSRHVTRLKMIQKELKSLRRY